MMRLHACHLCFLVLDEMRQKNESKALAQKAILKIAACDCGHTKVASPSSLDAWIHQLKLVIKEGTSLKASLADAKRGDKQGKNNPRCPQQLSGWTWSTARDI